MGMEALSFLGFRCMLYLVLTKVILVFVVTGSGGVLENKTFLTRILFIQTLKAITGMWLYNYIYLFFVSSEVLAF